MPLLESMVMELPTPVFPSVSSEMFDHEDADIHVEEQVAYFRSSEISFVYEM
tara:strand:+ start:297 stop:452 length:156 start_codon:yes stop_codon:yes gene_type:complete